MPVLPQLTESVVFSELATRFLEISFLVSHYQCICKAWLLGPSRHFSFANLLLIYPGCREHGSAILQLVWAFSILSNVGATADWLPLTVPLKGF